MISYQKEDLYILIDPSSLPFYSRSHEPVPEAQISALDFL